MRTCILICLALVIGHFTGAWFHERDIQKMCRIHGNSGLATWQGAFSCQITGEEDD